MTLESPASNDLFEHAPPAAIERRLGLTRPNAPNIGRRALIMVLVGWAPLMVLAGLHGLLTGPEPFVSLLREIGVHARYLIAIPLLVLAETECAARLSRITYHFMDSGIVPESQRALFGEAIASTRRRLHAGAAEAAVPALAYAVALLTIFTYAADQLPVWARSGAGGLSLSPAGWWHTFVSLPLLLILIFGWMWRLLLWARLLWLLARLDLRLVASHPDRSAGLGFLGQSTRAFSVVALALAAIIAGRSARFVLDHGDLPTPYLYGNIASLAVLMMLFVAPLLMFSPRLMQAWRTGECDYGTLASRVGSAFEQKWLAPDTRIDRDALDRPDFSATTDLYAVVSNVHEMRFVPVSARDLATLAAALLLPFIPVVLLAVPLELVWKGVKSLLL